MAKVGRPTDYSEEIVAIALDYIETYESKYNHAMPSVVGLCSVINRARTTVYRWAEDEENKFSYILDMIMEKQQLVLFNGALKNDLNANIAKLALGKHGYSDRQDVEVVDKTPPTPEKRKFRISELLNKSKVE
jgi:hypothetical protein